MTDFLFLDSKITVDGDCSHKIRRQLLLGRKAMTNLDSVLKSKDRRRKWQPTPVFLPGESQGWGRTESDTTEVTQQ